MANTFTSLQYHVVFSTKKRKPWIVADIQERVWTIPWAKAAWLPSRASLRDIFSAGEELAVMTE